MANDFLGQILGSVLGIAQSAIKALSGGGLEDLLGRLQWVALVQSEPVAVLVA
jgi:hypothetical protein